MEATSFSFTLPSTDTTPVATLLPCNAMAGRGSVPPSAKMPGFWGIIGTAIAVVMRTLPSEPTVRT
jgi:hypothetical protein